MTDTLIHSYDILYIKYSNLIFKLNIQIKNSHAIESLTGDTYQIGRFDISSLSPLLPRLRQFRQSTKFQPNSGKMSKSTHYQTFPITTFTSNQIPGVTTHV